MQNVTNENLSRTAQNSARAVSGNPARIADQHTDVNSRVSHLRDQVGNVVSTDIKIASWVTGTVMSQIPKVIKQVETTIRRYPLIAVGVAMGFGAVSMRLLLARNPRASQRI